MDKQPWHGIRHLRPRREYSILKFAKQEVIDKRQAQEVLLARAEADKAADRGPKRRKVEVAAPWGAGPRRHGSGG